MATSTKRTPHLSSLSAMMLLLLASLPDSAGALTLTTPSYLITLTINCEEGVVGCDDVTYVGVNRNNKKSIRLKGRERMHYCPGDEGDGPGKTPCHHEGYEFHNGKTKYYISDDGTLEVSQGAKILLLEQGTLE
ncbi:MAG: hypothetical protein ACXWFX_06900 [Methylobacter sp.]